MSHRTLTTTAKLSSHTDKTKHSFFCFIFLFLLFPLFSSSSFFFFFFIFLPCLSFFFLFLLLPLFSFFFCCCLLRPLRCAPHQPADKILCDTCSPFVEDVLIQNCVFSDKYRNTAYNDGTVSRRALRMVAAAFCNTASITNLTLITSASLLRCYYSFISFFYRTRLFISFFLTRLCSFSFGRPRLDQTCPFKLKARSYVQFRYRIVTDIHEQNMRGFTTKAALI